MSRIPSANHLPQPGRRKCITLQLVSREQGSWNGQLAIKQCPRQGRRKGGKPPATARLRTPACLTGTSLTPAAHQAPSASAPARTREVWQQGWQPSCPLDPFPLRRGRRNSQQDCDSSGVLQDFSVILRWCAYDRHTLLVIGTPVLVIGTPVKEQICRFSLSSALIVSQSWAPKHRIRSPTKWSWVRRWVLQQVPPPGTQTPPLCEMGLSSRPITVRSSWTGSPLESSGFVLPSNVQWAGETGGTWEIIGDDSQVPPESPCSVI